MDQDFRPKKMKNASLPLGVRAERYWCGHVAKVKQVEDFGGLVRHEIVHVREL